jgi:hypothetical protein
MEMPELEAQRTLVKSVPELWAQLSEPEQLAPLLDDAFGEIRITRLEPESLIAWESERARGQVELAESGFGTKVRLTAQIAEPEQPPHSGLLQRLLGRLRRAEPQAPQPPALAPGVAEHALGALLDDVGAAHHRPFSR